MSRMASRFAALGLLLGLVILAGSTAYGWIDSYAEGEREIADKRVELQSLHNLAQARAELAHLVGRSGRPGLILSSTDDGQAALAAAIGRAAESQQVIVDSIEPLPPGNPTQVVANVRLRGTQNGLYSFLRAIEEQSPYLLVPRLELSLSRPADLDRAKPLILSSELRVAALATPAAPAKAEPAPRDPDP